MFVSSGALPNDSEALLAALSSSEAYAHAPESVERIETHISWLFLAGVRVYKLKKPVELGFLDFTTLERRRACCEDEVRLNRRLTPWMYRGVVPVRRDAGGRIVVGDGPGDVVEWAVEMERLPEPRMLASMLERGEIDNTHVRTLAERLADFHAAAATEEGVDEHGAPEAVAHNARENFEQLRPFAGDVLPEGVLRFLERRTEEFLARSGARLEARVREGRVRDGHGDLHAGNVCFAPRGLAIYDCIEFNRRFRCGDVAADLAFLAMDLDLRGFPAFGGYLLRDYAERTGDRGLAELLPFYKGYRAIVRAKVAAFTLAGREGDARERARREALRYLQLAASYELPSVLVLFCEPEDGEASRDARELATPLRAAVLHEDVQRRAREAGAGGSRDVEDATYRALLEQVVEHLERGQSVVVDAGFQRPEQRRPFVDAAVRLGHPCALVRTPGSAVGPLETPAHLVVDARTSGGAPEELGVRLVEALIEST